VIDWAVVDEAAGAEVVVASVVVWTDVVAVVVAIRGNTRGIVAIGDANGVRQIAWRRESSSGSRVLSESDIGGSNGDFGGSGVSASGVSIHV